jgi:Cap4 SAVED domain
VSATPAAPAIQSDSSLGPAASKPLHIQWLVDTGARLTTVDGKIIEVWELQHTDDPAILSAWAKHFRNHYCSDGDIDFLRAARSRKDYLEEIKFPSRTSNLGPGIRAGDFGEILVADYLQWILGYWVPRVRWNAKIVRDESSKGSDVIGFRFHSPAGTSPQDILAVFESKTKFSAGSSANRLQDAINDSAKDHIRIDESLNYIKQRLFDKGQVDEAAKIERFQNPVDLPYREIFGATALYTSNEFRPPDVSAADCQNVPCSSSPTGFQPHPNHDGMVLVVIKGSDMMSLVHSLYQRAADEA